MPLSPKAVEALCEWYRFPSGRPAEDGVGKAINPIPTDDGEMLAELLDDDMIVLCNGGYFPTDKGIAEAERNIPPAEYQVWYWDCTDTATGRWIGCVEETESRVKAKASKKFGIAESFITITKREPK
jgi:hypothetical protein